MNDDFWSVSADTKTCGSPLNICHLYGGLYYTKFQTKVKKKRQKIGHREGFRQIQVFCFRFDNCNNTILVYAYILIYYRLAVVSGYVKVVV